MEQFSPDTAILLKNVKKTFKVRQYPSRSIRDKIFNLLKPNPYKTIEALKEINLEIKKGEFFGIIGQNGSGKSTLMNIMSGVYLPDKGGSVIINGSHLKLSLGLGFNAELTARQNIYTNASLLGMSFKQIGQKFDEIVNFAGLNAFVDTPVKYYSRGMKSRLALAIAIHAKSEIFLLDEVLGGIGDLGFIKRATQAFKQHIIRGNTVILISHNMSPIINHCERVLLIDKGEPLAIGNPTDIVEAYKHLISREEANKKNKTVTF